MSDHTQILELIPLYALDALDGTERDLVEGHIEGCDICLAELASHRRVAAELVPGGAAPADVWTRIESAIGEPADNVHRLDPGAARRAGPLVWLAAAAAAVVLAIGGVVVGQRFALNDISGDAGVVAAADAAARQPGSLVTEFLVDEVAVARVILTEDGLGYIVPTEALDALSEDRTYQLWVLTPDELAISAGVLGNDPGPATFTWKGDLAGLALTREVAGGVVSSEGDVVSVVTDA